MRDDRGVKLAADAPEADFQRLMSQPFDERTSLGDIFYCFRLVLGRKPDNDEISMHTWRAGQKLEDVVATYLNSHEFENRNLSKNKMLDKVRLAKLDGFSIYYQEDDVDVGMAVAKRAYEPEIEKIFRNTIKAGMTVVDIGANIGFFTMLSASLVGPRGRVVAVEPNPVNVKLVEASRRANGFENVEIHAVAANEAPGILVLNTSFSNGSVHELGDNMNGLLRSDVVYGVQLDRALTLDRLDFLKIDVEGAEYKALRGFRETLARFRPTIVSEFSPPNYSDRGEGYLAFLLDLGYRLGVVQPSGGVDDMGVDKAAVMQAWRDRGGDHIDLLATPAR